MRFSGTNAMQGTAGKLLVWLAVLLSGGAGIINQVIWQRGLTVHLGGSESLSTMCVVVVFLGGLGLGSGLGGGLSARLNRPLVGLAVVELALAVVNFGVARILHQTGDETLLNILRWALGQGIPLWCAQLALAWGTLAIPCLLMGMTAPLASETLQREFGESDRRLIGRLLAVNTLGAVVGGLAGGFYLLGWRGQYVSLQFAAALNVCAGCLVMLARFWRGAPIPTRNELTISQSRTNVGAKLTREDWAGFVLGFAGLAYEMHLFRMQVLSWQPLPGTFATVLCGYLLAWSLGAWLGDRIKWPLSVQAVACGAGIAASTFLVDWMRWEVSQPTWRMILSASSFLPCLLFGSQYARLISERVREWGSDVGRFCMVNTLGCCLGAMAFTVWGYEVNLVSAAGVLAAMFVGCGLVFASWSNSTHANWLRLGAWGTAGLSMAMLAAGIQERFQQRSNGVRSYFGRNGVVEVSEKGLMFWDGLEHSTLHYDGDQVGDNNWILAAAPMLCHDDEQFGPIRRTLVIGLGCGTTVGTLAKGESVERVDVYDINPTLQRIVEDYPEGTQFVGDNPKVRIEWRDGRGGLALNEQQYDLITQQPLYLMQSGSSLLLSREYLKLVKQRLKPGGIFCAYAYDFGHPELSLLVRQTVVEAFPYCESVWNGWLIVASNEPMQLDAEQWTAKLRRDDELFTEIAGYARKLRSQEGKSLAEMLDRPRLEWKRTRHVVTDDHPLLEYHTAARRLMQLATFSNNTPTGPSAPR